MGIVQCYIFRFTMSYDGEKFFISLPAFYQSTMILDQKIYQTERIYKKFCYTPFPEKREVH